MKHSLVTSLVTPLLAKMAGELVDQASSDIGFEELKDKQKEAIIRFLESNDIFVRVLFHCQSTGFGKSLVILCSIW